MEGLLDLMLDTPQASRFLLVTFVPSLCLGV